LKARERGGKEGEKERELTAARHILVNSIISAN